MGPEEGPEPVEKVDEVEAIKVEVADVAEGPLVQEAGEAFADSVVRCSCGAREDDGEMMVECEDCKEWAHVDCIVSQGSLSRFAL